MKEYSLKNYSNIEFYQCTFSLYLESAKVETNTPCQILIQWAMVGNMASLFTSSQKQLEPQTNTLFTEFQEFSVEMFYDRTTNKFFMKDTIFALYVQWQDSNSIMLASKHINLADIIVNEEYKHLEEHELETAEQENPEAYVTFKVNLTSKKASKSMNRAGNRSEVWSNDPLEGKGRVPIQMMQSLPVKMIDREKQKQNAEINHLSISFSDDHFMHQEATPFQDEQPNNHELLQKMTKQLESEKQKGEKYKKEMEELRQEMTIKDQYIFMLQKTVEKEKKNVAEVQKNKYKEIKQLNLKHQWEDKKNMIHFKTLAQTSHSKDQQLQIVHQKMTQLTGKLLIAQQLNDELQTRLKQKQKTTQSDKKFEKRMKKTQEELNLAIKENTQLRKEIQTIKTEIDKVNTPFDASNSRIFSPASFSSKDLAEYFLCESKELPKRNEKDHEESIMQEYQQYKQLCEAKLQKMEEHISVIEQQGINLLRYCYESVLKGENGLEEKKLKQMVKKLGQIFNNLQEKQINTEKNNEVEERPEKLRIIFSKNQPEEEQFESSQGLHQSNSLESNQFSQKTIVKENKTQEQNPEAEHLKSKIKDLTIQLDSLKQECEQQQWKINEQMIIVEENQRLIQLLKEDKKCLQEKLCSELRYQEQIEIKLQESEKIISVLGKQEDSLLEQIQQLQKQTKQFVQNQSKWKVELFEYQRIIEKEIKIMKKLKQELKDRDQDQKKGQLIQINAILLFLIKFKKKMGKQQQELLDPIFQFVGNIMEGNSEGTFSD